MPIKTYSARDLRDSQFMSDNAVSIITSHGRPVKVAIPFDDILLNEGITRSLALNLVKNHLITPTRGAEMVKMSLSTFLELMAKFSIPAAEQTATELEDEVSYFL